MQKMFRGAGVALITPFDNEANVDFEALVSHVDYVIEGGVDYLLALGTTSEVPTLSFDEQVAVVDAVIKENSRQVPLLVGVGGNSTSEVIKNIKFYEDREIDAFLVVTPYYNKPSQKGLYEHYAAVAKSTRKPLILYNIPARASVNMLPQTTLSLARDFPNIMGIKEASGIMSQIMKIIKNRVDDFLVISGDDIITLPLMSAGAHGVISVVANAFPGELSMMIDYIENGDYQTASEIHYKLFDIIQACFAEGNPVGVKAIMSEMNLIESAVRLPLVEASSDLKENIKLLLKQI